MFYSLTIFTILCMRVQAGPVTTTKPDEDHFHVAAGDLEALLEELTTKHPKDISIVHTNEIKAGNPLETLLTGGSEKVDELEDKLEEVEDLLKDLHEDLVEVSKLIILLNSLYVNLSSSYNLLALSLWSNP